MINIYLGELINIKLYVSILLIISSLVLLYKNRISKLTKILYVYRKLILISIGSIHGATNMGGAFLSIFSSSINNENRQYTRNYIAYGYFVMGVNSIYNYFNIWNNEQRFFKTLLYHYAFNCFLSLTNFL